MIKENAHKMSLAILTGIALLVVSIPAGAQTLTPQFNELILGLRATGGQGQTLNLEVIVGNVSNFYGAAAGTTIPLPALAVQDLVNTYGANWSTRTDLVWGAISTTGRASGTSDGHAPKDTLWATAPSGANAWNRGSSSAQGLASGNIEVLYVAGSPGTLLGATPTTNSSSSAVIDATQVGSWSAQDLKSLGQSFSFFNPTIDNAVTNPAVSQLYELQPGSGPSTLLGDLILTSSGLSFQAAAGAETRIIGVSGSLAFGNVTTGATSTATLTIANSGNATLTVSGISYPTGFSGAFSGAIAAGVSTNVTVTFAPVALISYGGTVTVNSDATSGTSTIAASGTGITTATPIIGVSGNLAFGNVTTGTTATATLTITNSGNATLTVSSIAYPSDFSGAFSGAIAAGASTNVTVTFAPVALISYGGTVTVNSDATRGTSTIAASGTGIPTPTRIIDVSGTLAFGNVPTGTTATATLTITNSGNATLTVSSIAYPSGFSGAFSGTIPAGGSQGVTVTFAPVALISYSGNVTVNSDATSGTGTIAASGTGVALPTRVIGLSGNLAFGNLTTGTTATATLTITNAGNSTLTVSSIAYPSGFSGAFSGAIAAGGSHGVTVTFAPVALISYGGTVTVNSDATSGTGTIAASGTGTAVISTNHAPVFVLGPLVNNAVLSNGTLFVVVADSPAFFVALATDADGDPVSYHWDFGDGATASGALASNTYAECGPFNASVVATDGLLSNTAPLTVSVPCQFDTNTAIKLQMKVNFAKTGRDSVKLQGAVELDSAFIPTGKQVLLDVGDATLAFVLNSKGLGTNPLGKVQLKFNRKTGNWTVKATLSRGTWREPWANHGLVNATKLKPGVPVTVPVILVVGTESFMDEPVLTYRSAQDKSGQAK